MATPDDMERQIDAWAAQVHDKAQRYQQLKTEIADISAVAVGANGTIRVTVGPSGLLTKLELSEHTRTMQASYLAEQIMATIHAAQAKLGPKVVALMEERVGEDKASIAVVAGNYARQFSLEPLDDSTIHDESTNDPADVFLRNLPGDSPG